MTPNNYAKNMYYSDPVAIGGIVCLLFSLHDQCRTSEIKLGDTFKSLKMDDFAKLDVIMAIEREFDFEFSDLEIESMKNIGDIVEHLSKSYHIH